MDKRVGERWVEPQVLEKVSFNYVLICISVTEDLNSKKTG